MINSGPYPKVSIILPTWNRAGYIVETIGSIRDQTYTNWELLIIDDGSTDNTEELVAQIEDKRIQFYKTGTKLGITGTRNDGLRKAGGDLIAFMDSDDLWAATKLEKQVNALHEYPGAGFSLTGGFNFKEPFEVVDYFYKKREGIKYDNVLIPFFRSEISATTPSLLFRKECLATTGLFDESKPFAKMDLFLKLADNFKAVILYEALLYRRLHDSNVSSKVWETGYKDGIAMIMAYKERLPPKVVRSALFSLYVNFGEDCLLHKESSKAVSKFFKAWTNRPLSIIPLRKTGKAIAQSFR